MNRRQSLQRLSYLAAPLSVSSCAQVANLSRLALQNSYLVGQNTLLSKLVPYFPFSQQYQGVGQINLSQPNFTMLPDQNKIRLGLTTTAGLADNLGQTAGFEFLRELAGRSTSGTCQLACGLRFNPANNGVYLKDPVLEELNLTSLGSTYTEPARNLINLVGPKILDEHPIHTLEPSFATRALKALNVRSNGLELDFSPGANAS